MLIASLVNDNKFLLVEGNTDELDQVRLSFTKKINSWFIIKKKCPNVTVDEKFMNSIGMIPVGLWVELINVCRKFNYSLSFSADFNGQVINTEITEESFTQFANELFSKSDISPKDYQIAAAFNMIKYKNCCVEVSTSGGKTLISYMMFRYMKYVLGLGKILFVTPKTNLTTQSAEKFIEYDRMNKIQTDWKYGEIHATAKKKKKESDDVDIVFGNYQSLTRKNPDFFEGFDAIILDEAHHGQNASCRNIMKKCRNVKYKIGMTGTFPPDGSYDSFVLQSYIGPVVYRLSSYELINEEKFATPVSINMISLRYLNSIELKALYDLRNVSKKEDPTLGNRIFNEEKNVMRDSKKRFRYIVDMISKVTKNTLVLFSDIQGGYGRKIYNHLRENTDKRVYYIDGNIAASTRSKIIKEMENDLDENTIIVASIPCFSEGIDIANMWNIFIVETTKSENTVAQILGRGMRRFEGKEKTVVIDFIDDYRYGSGPFEKNYLYKHGMSRYDIYSKRGFPCVIAEVDLTWIQNKLI